VSGPARELLLQALDLVVREAVREALQEAQGAAPRPEGFIGTAEAARRASCKPDAVLDWIRRGLLTATRPPGAKGWRIRPADLEDFLGGKSTGPKPVDLEAARRERAAKLTGQGKAGR
jgi:excisionase family DNA binding protein